MHVLRQECRGRAKRLEKSEEEGQTDRRWKAELDLVGPSHSAGVRTLNFILSGMERGWRGSLSGGVM